MDAEYELQQEHDARYGDPRVCPRHPHIVTSSPDGMFDCDCRECESEMAQPPADDNWDADRHERVNGG